MKKIFAIALMASISFAGFAKGEEQAEEPISKLEVVKTSFSDFEKTLEEEQELYSGYKKLVPQFLVTANEENAKKNNSSVLKTIKKEESKFNIEFNGISPLNENEYSVNFDITSNYKIDSRKDEGTSYSSKYEVSLKYIFKKDNIDKIIVEEVKAITNTKSELKQKEQEAINAIENWYKNIPTDILDGGTFQNAEGKIAVKSVNEGYKSTSTKVIYYSKPLDYSKLTNPEEYVENQSIKYSITPSFEVKEGVVSVTCGKPTQITKPQNKLDVIKRKANANTTINNFKKAIEAKDIEALKQLFKDLSQEAVQVSYLKGKEVIKDRKGETYFKNVNLDKLQIEDMGSVIFNKENGEYSAIFTQKFTSDNYSDKTDKIIKFYFDENNNCSIEKVVVVEGSTEKID